jgi:hypothetical protein
LKDVHIAGQWNGIAGQPQPFGIEGLGQQTSRSHVNQ